MKLLLATLLLTTPALAQDEKGYSSHSDCDGDDGSRKVVRVSAAVYERYVDTFLNPTRPLPGGDDSGMVNIVAPGTTDLLGELWLKALGNDQGHAWFTGPDFAGPDAHEFDLVFSDRVSVCDVEDKVGPWPRVVFMDVDEADPPDEDDDAYGNVTVVAPGVIRHTYELTSSSGTHLGYMLHEIIGDHEFRYWAIEGAYSLRDLFKNEKTDRILVRLADEQAGGPLSFLDLAISTDTHQWTGAADAAPGATFSSGYDCK